MSARIYFASDIHLGVANSAEREKQFVRWLQTILADEEAEALYLVGDIFDFWFEYKTVVPKGFLRSLGLLAQLADRGLDLHFFTGNHDVWMFDYFEKELGAKIHRDPIQVCLQGQNFLIGHGDGLGPGDHGYKFIKKIFRNSFCQWLFRWLHPDIGAALAQFFSHSSRAAQDGPQNFLGSEKEWLILYCQRKKERCPAVKFFMFGHRHLAQDLRLDESGRRYINLGDWFSQPTFARLEDGKLRLHYFEHPEGLDILAEQNLAELPT
ncbi:UDP-2,3-diacylglucosamine diphosphatase [Saprospira grandis]|uniref:UDP-2,3-diacylglucosamine diphosphatase n=1 Tax=Saprospira grandis TaxID=1008 RepID=UPI0022DDAB11|nr:UDP-2,3-diacylglucosamine diphosphatase [Saprospira grandis]WBM75205.1 UDP-2,3-diacylglucosamine diphosphatase [Saprospira grandis]